MADSGINATSPRAVFPRLTEKQHEVLRFVAENRTSKEIAFELGISESAVNQRIEGVRNRTGSPPRAELARAYRLYLLGVHADGVAPAGSSQAPAEPGPTISQDGEGEGPETIGADPVVRLETHLDLRRPVTMTAAGLLLLTTVGLGVAWALGSLF